jgi:hypothetical protein
MTSNSCVPATLTQTLLPSGVKATPWGLAAPRSFSSRPIVPITRRWRTSMTLTTLVLIQPMSTRNGSSSKLEKRCVTTAWRPSGEIAMP